MKKSLSLILALVMLFGLLAGCGGSKTEESAGASSSSGAAAPAEDRVLRMTSSEVLPTIDPEEIHKLRVNEIIYNVYEGLIYYNYEEGKAEPRVAESYEISDDGTVYTFKIRDGVKLHNGADLTMDDIIFSYDKAMASPTRVNHIAAIDSYRAVDDKTFEVTLKYASAPFIQFCSELFIYSKAFAEERDGVLTTEACGTGPYAITSCDLNTMVILEAFEDYYRGPASIKKIEWAVITDSTSAAMALQSGDLDFLQVAWAQAANLEAEGFTIGEIPSRHTTYFSFNCSKEPFDDPKFRQAITYFIDREEIALVAFDGYATPAKFAIHPDMIGFPQDKSKMEPYAMTFNPEKGKEMLKELGYDLDKEALDLGEMLCFSEGHYLYKPAQVIQDQLSRYNIKVTMKCDTTNFFPTYYSGNFGIAVCGHSCGGDASAYSTVFCTSTMGMSAGNSHYDYNYKMDELFAKSLSTAGEEREQVFLDILAELQANVPEIGLAHKQVIAAYKADELNVVLRMDNPLIYEWSWK